MRDEPLWEKFLCKDGIHLMFPYIHTKPMHGSQKIVSENKNSIIIQLLIHVNYEFKSLLFSHMEKIKVLEPKELFDEVKQKINTMMKNYK